MCNVGHLNSIGSLPYSCRFIATCGSDVVSVRTKGYSVYFLFMRKHYKIAAARNFPYPCSIVSTCGREEMSIGTESQRFYLLVMDKLHQRMTTWHLPYGCLLLLHRGESCLITSNGNHVVSIRAEDYQANLVFML